MDQTPASPDPNAGMPSTGTPGSDLPNVGPRAEEPTGQAAPVNSAAMVATSIWPRRPRIWPLLVLVVILWLLRLGAVLGAESPMVFFWCFVILPVGLAVIALVWWLFLSRVPWSERLTLLAVLLVGGAGCVAVNSKNFPPIALVMYAIPTVLTIWAGWLLVAVRQPAAVRQWGLATLMLATFVFFSLLRIDGWDGSFRPAFAWRWTQTAEERLLAEQRTKPAPAAPVLDTPITLGPGDWPEFRGPARDSRLTGVSIPTDWSATPPTELWQHRLGPGWSSFAVVGGFLFTQEQRGDAELTVCYDADRGRQVWAHQEPVRFYEVVAGAGPRATPTFHEGRIYAQGATGLLTCLDAATGQELWQADLVADQGGKIPEWGFSSSPLVLGAAVIAFGGVEAKGSVVAYHRQTGIPLWAAGIGTHTYSSPHRAVLHGTEQILMLTEKGLQALAPADGKVLWTHTWETGGIVRCIQPAVIGDTDILIGTGLGVGTRRIRVAKEGDNWSTTEQWTTPKFKPYYNDFVVHDGHAYGFDGAFFQCVDLKDGSVSWKARGYGSGQVLLLADQALLLITSEEGDVALVKATPENHEEIARFHAVDGKTWNHPVLVRDRLYLRNGESMAAYAFGPTPPAVANTAPPRSSR